MFVISIFRVFHLYKKNQEKSGGTKNNCRYTAERKSTSRKEAKEAQRYEKAIPEKN